MFPIIGVFQESWLPYFRNFASSTTPNWHLTSWQMMKGHSDCTTPPAPPQPFTENAKHPQETMEVPFYTFLNLILSLPAQELRSFLRAPLWIIRSPGSGVIEMRSVFCFRLCHWSSLSFEHVAGTSSLSILIVSVRKVHSWEAMGGKLSSSYINSHP